MDELYYIFLCRKYTANSNADNGRPFQCRQWTAISVQTMDSHFSADNIQPIPVQTMDGHLQCRQWTVNQVRTMEDYILNSMEKEYTRSTFFRFCIYGSTNGLPAPPPPSPPPTHQRLKDERSKVNWGL